MPKFIEVTEIREGLCQPVSVNADMIVFYRATDDNPTQTYMMLTTGPVLLNEAYVRVFLKLEPN